MRVRRSSFVLLTCVLAASMALPASADPYVGYHLSQGTLIEMGQPDGMETEVHFFAWESKVYADSDGAEGEEPFGCVEIFSNNVYDGGCGPLTIEMSPAGDTISLSGTMEAFAYAYTPDEEEWWQEIGPSNITLDVTLTQDGAPRVAHDEGTGPGVCGLPPDTRGVLLMARAPMERVMTPTGSLTSDVLGAVDVAPLNASAQNGTALFAGACVD